MKTKNKGFTFFELLIASLIGFIVTSTAIDLIYSSSQSTSMKSEISKLQQDGLFASILLVNDFYKAGDLDYGKSTYGRDPFDWSKTGPEDLFNDEVAIRFYNHDSITDCAGHSNVGILENHYRVENNTFYCNDLEIIDNVERFNLYYGVDLTGNGNVDRFVKRDLAMQLNNESDKKLIAIRFSLLLRSEEEYGFSSEYEFKLANGETVIYQDGKAYRLFKRTILLRNML